MFPLKQFYAPVFSGVRYKDAGAVDDYASAFAAQLQKIELSEKSVVFSCNRILSYLYSDLKGKNTAPFVGPITFGEIAYQLLNQPLVYLHTRCLIFLEEISQHNGMIG